MEENLIEVKVNNPGKNSRWYSGSGIYRNVFLRIENPVHLIPESLQLISKQIGNRAEVTLSGEIASFKPSNSKKLAVEIIDKKGKVAAKEIFQIANSSFEKKLSVLNPQWWSPENPHLYTVRFQLYNGNQLLDEHELDYGIRTIDFLANKGFLLNNIPIELKGGCIHHDNGPLGAKAIYRAEERKVEILKKNGFNAIRSAHNPPSEELLKACDRLGMLVINEAFDMWQLPKNSEDYHLYFDEDWKKSLSAFVKRDRNHASVIMWSVGNEIKERADSSGLETTKKLVAKVKELDPTRPVTEAVCVFWETKKPWEASAKAFALLDVAAYNYEWRNYEPDHEKYPNRIIVGTESFALEALENWEMVIKYPYIIGDFVWTAVDYMGEAGIGHAVPANEPDSPTMPWPWYNGYCGDIDLIGNKKAQSYYRDVVWGQRKMAVLVSDGKPEKVSKWGWPTEYPTWSWQPKKLDSVTVRVYSHYPEVLLKINEKTVARSQAKKGITHTFRVPFVAGKLVAYGIENGVMKDSVLLQSADALAKIELTPDRSVLKSTETDLCYVTVSVKDVANEDIIFEEQQISFTLEGAGKIVAVGNAHPSQPQSFESTLVKTFQGKALVIIQTQKNQKGDILLKATSGKMNSQVTLKVN